MIGDDRYIEFWNDETGRGMLRQVFPRIFSLARNKMARSAILGLGMMGGGSGSLRLGDEFLIGRWMYERSLGTPREGILPVDGTRDRIIWGLMSSSYFSCHSFQRAFSRGDPVSERWLNLWGLPAPLKVKCFVWLLLRDRVAVRERLLRLGVIEVDRSSCPLCGTVVESCWHLFMHCDRVYKLWSRLTNL